MDLFLSDRKRTRVGLIPAHKASVGVLQDKGSEVSREAQANPASRNAAT
jgi:hypothetical protein